MELRNIRATFVGFGEINTPRELIERKCREAAGLLVAQGLELIRTTPVSDDPEGNDVWRAKEELAGKDFDVLVVVCLAGWIPSHAVIDVIDPFKHRPMILWGLSGWQEDDRFVTTADQAGTTALRKPMQDLGYRFKYVVNRAGAQPPVDQVVSFAKAARAQPCARSRIGQMGYRDMRLYGTLYDGVSLCAVIGPEVEFFEMLEMAQAIEGLDESTVGALANRVRERWAFVKSPAEGTIENTVRLYLALKQKVAERGYQGVSLIDVDGVKKLMKFAPAGVFMLLHEEDDVCTIPENDTMGAVTQLITRHLTGQVGAYMEFYEFTEDGMLIGVPDYVPTEIVDGPVTVMPTAFGEFGEGLLNVSRVKTGPVTLARLTYSGDRYTMHVATGEAAVPRKWEEAGWAPPAPQLPSLEVTLNGNLNHFIQNVFGQHYILSYGDHTEAFADLCDILGVELVRS